MIVNNIVIVMFPTSSPIINSYFVIVSAVISSVAKSSGSPETVTDVIVDSAPGWGNLNKNGWNRNIVTPAQEGSDSC